jgi:hypothetical protein
LYRFIKITVLSQTEYQYPFATVNDQELSFYSFKQDNLSNPQWYERFKTKVDGSGSIGVTRQHKVLLEYVAQESYTRAFAGLGAAERHLVIDDAEEQYISYAFLCQSGTQHGNLKVDLQNDLTTRDNHYPNNRQQTLHLLDKYSKTVVAKVTHSEGTSFAQKSGRGGGNQGSNGNVKGLDSGIYDKITGRTRNATSATRKGIQQRIALRSQVTMMIVLPRALLAALRNSRRILNPSRKHSPQSTPSSHSS